MAKHFLDTDGLAYFWKTKIVPLIDKDVEEERVARINKDDILQDHIDDEATTRETNDNTLQDNIDAEAESRETKDDDLQEQIDDIINLTNAEIDEACKED